MGTQQAIDEMRVRLRGGLHPGPRQAAVSGPSDYDLNAGWKDAAGEPGLATRLKPAAVLIPVVAEPPFSVIFTRRTEQLRSHAGQISFPGGKIDPGEDAYVTALREAEEEIGLTPECVEPIGFLDTYRTRTGYSIEPLVAFVRPGFTAMPNPEEVAFVFEVPFSFLVDPANHHRHSRMHEGKERHFYAMSYEDHYIWGATAGMVRNLYARLTQV